MVTQRNPNHSATGSFRPWRARPGGWAPWLLPVLLITATSSASAQTTSRWLNGVDGDWDDPAKWSTTAFPDNGSPNPSDTYNAVVGATGSSPYTVDLHTEVTLDSLVLNSANATLELRKPGDLSVLGPFELRAGNLVLNGGTITGGTITSTVGTPVQIRSGTFDGVLLDADAKIVPPRFGGLSVHNGLTLNNRTIVLSSGDSGARPEMEFLGPDALLGGQGVIRFTGRGSSLPWGAHPRVAASTGTLTIGPDILIEALSRVGQVGNDDTGLVNNGVIRVGTFGDLIITGQNWVNNGTIEIEPDGALRVGGVVRTPDLGTIVNNGGRMLIVGTLDNTGQTLDYDTLGPFDLVTGGGTIKGGTLTGTSPLEFELSSNVFPYPSLDGVVLDVDMLLRGSYALGVENGLTLNNRKVKFAEACGLVLAGGTLDGDGELVVNTPGAEIRGSQFVIGPNITIRTGLSAGTVSVDIGDRFSENWGNQGTIVVDKGTVKLGGSGWSNQGVIEHSGGSLHFSGSYTTAAIGNLIHTGGEVILEGRMDNTGDTLLLDASTGSWDLRGRVVGGTIETADGAALVVGPSQQAQLEGVTLAGDMILRDHVEVHIENDLALDGGTIRFAGPTSSEIHLPGVQTISGQGEIIFDGQDNENWIRLFTGSQLTIGEGVTVRTGTGSGQIGTSDLPLKNEGTISAQTPGEEIRVRATFANLGRLRASNGGTLNIASPDWTNDGTITLFHGTLAVGAGSPLLLTNGTAGRIEGIGMLDGADDTTFINDGRVAPGVTLPILDVLGTLTFDGDYRQTASGLLSIDARRAAAGSFDKLAVTGAAEIAGSLEVGLVRRAGFDYGDTLDLLTAASVTGQFDEVVLPTLPGGEPMFSLAYRPDRVTLTYVPEPSSFILIIAGSALLAGYGWRRKRRLACGNDRRKCRQPMASARCRKSARRGYGDAAGKPANVVDSISSAAAKPLPTLVVRRCNVAWTATRLWPQRCILPRNGS